MVKLITLPGNGQLYFGPPRVIIGDPLLQPIVNGITRDIGTISGGTTLDIRGWNFTQNAQVSVDGKSATTTYVNSSRLRIITPSGTTTGSKDVTISQAGGTTTLTSSFQYVNAPTQIFGTSSFSNGLTTPFAINGTQTSISADFPEVGGTKSLKCIANGSDTVEESVSLLLPAQSGNIMLANGVWCTWDALVPTSVLSQLTGQIKTTLFRRSDNSGPEYSHEGIGSQVGSMPPTSSGVAVGSFFTGNTHVGWNYEGSRWVHHAMWVQRSPGAGEVKLYVGVNNMLKKVFDSTQAAFGEDTGSLQYNARFGAVFNQGNVNSSQNLIVYIGNLKISDGLLI